MRDAASPQDPRDELELMLRTLVRAIREHRPAGNITLRVPETGDFVVILQVDDHEASDLARMLGSAW